MSYVGRGIYVELSVSPHPVSRGSHGRYSVKVTNGKTIESEVLAGNSTMGPELQFAGRSPANQWIFQIQIPLASARTELHTLSVNAGTATEEFVECTSVERRDPVLKGPWEPCTQNVPIALRVQIT
jgi:hypothetical protein